MKDIKDYIHFYLKCWCEVSGSKDGLIDGEWALDGIILHSAMLGGCRIKLHLRPISAIQDDEKRELFKILYGDDQFNAMRLQFAVRLDSLNTEAFRYLLSRGFDLFGLISSGNAIDKTKV